MPVATAQPERTTRSRDGTRLFFRHWPAGSSRASLLIVHGYAEHSGRYEHVARFLNGLGISVYAVDMRGHGRSEGRRGYVERFSAYLDDVDAMLGVIAGAASPGELFILGHSNGGLIVLRHALDRRPSCRGVIVTSPFLGVAMKVSAIRVVLGNLMSIVAPSLALASGFPPEILSHDPAVGAAYAADPLVFKTVTPRWFTEATKAIGDLFARAGEITLPCLILQACDDRLADPRKSKPLYEALGSSDKNYIEYPGFYHEILNEVEKDKVFGDIRSWLLERLRQ